MYEQSIDLFIPFVYDHRFLGYAILFLAMVVEGEVFLIISGMLARIGAFDFADVLWVSFAGVMLGDVAWYFLGVLTTRFPRLSYLSRASERSVMFLLPRFRTKPFRSIFLSKFIYGANHATLILSGMLKVDFKLFLKAELVASFIWVCLFAVVGYVFGHAALLQTHKLSRVILLGFIFVVAFILVQQYLTKRYKNRGNNQKEKNSNS